MCLHNKWKLHTSSLQDTYFCINLATIFLPVCTIQSFNNILRCQLIPLPLNSQPSSISPPASLLPSPRLLHTLNPPSQQSYRIRGWCVYRTRKLGVAFVPYFRFRPMFLFSSYILFSSHIFYFVTYFNFRPMFLFSSYVFRPIPFVPQLRNPCGMISILYSTKTQSGNYEGLYVECFASFCH